MIVKGLTDNSRF